MRSDKIALSVIIPSYNAGALILDAVRSALFGKLPEREIIVVDDGSTDGTKDLLAGHIEKSAIRYVYQKNGGASSARNAGIEASRGEYIAFLDADDLLLPGSLRRRAAVLDENPDVDLVFTDYLVEHRRRGSEEGEGARERDRNQALLPHFEKALLRREGDTRVFGPGYFTVALETRGLFPFTGSTMIRRRRIDSVGGFDPGLTVAEDIDLWLRIARVAHVAYIDEPLSVYRTFEGGGSLSGDFERYHRETVRMLKNIDTSGDEEAGEHLRRYISDELLVLGRHLLRGKRRGEALRAIAESVRHCPGRARPYLHLLAIALPVALQERVRKALSPGASTGTP